MVGVTASLCIAVFVDDSDVLCLHWGSCSVQCCIEPPLKGPASVRGYTYTAPAIGN